MVASPSYTFVAFWYARLSQTVLVLIAASIFFRIMYLACKSIATGFRPWKKSQNYWALAKTTPQWQIDFG